MNCADGALVLVARYAIVANAFVDIEQLSSGSRKELKFVGKKGSQNKAASSKFVRSNVEAPGNSRGILEAAVKTPTRWKKLSAVHSCRNL